MGIKVFEKNSEDKLRYYLKIEEHWAGARLILCDQYGRRPPGCYLLTIKQDGSVITYPDVNVEAAKSAGITFPSDRDRLYEQRS